MTFDQLVAVSISIVGIVVVALTIADAFGNVVSYLTWRQRVAGTVKK